MKRLKPGQQFSISLRPSNVGFYIHVQVGGAHYEIHAPVAEVERLVGTLVDAVDRHPRAQRDTVPPTC